MQSKDMCQRCNQRQGHPWDGTGGFNCLCGPCKIKVVFEIPAFRQELIAQGHDQKVEVQFDFSDDEGVN